MLSFKTRRDETKTGRVEIERARERESRDDLHAAAIAHPVVSSIPLHTPPRLALQPSLVALYPTTTSDQV